MSDILLTDALGTPKRSHNAQMGTKIVFWYNRDTDHILQGAPEHFEPIYGYQKIVCNHASEAELWSKRLREQDKKFAEMSDIEQEQREAPMRAHIRKEILYKMANPSPGGDPRRKRLNHIMLQKALDQLDLCEAKGKTVRDSYLHAEAFEKGK